MFSFTTADISKLFHLKAQLPDVALGNANILTFKVEVMFASTLFIKMAAL